MNRMKQIDLKPLFMDLFGTADMSNVVDCDMIKNACLQYKERYPTSVNKSNLGGWQSPHLGEEILKKEGPELAYIIDMCTQYVQAVTRDNKTSTVTPVEAWININGPGHSNAKHTHPGCQISTIFYPYVPPTRDAGGLVLYRGREYTDYFMTEFWRPQPDKLNPANVPYIEIVPTTGMFLLFPSYIEHQVLPNNTKQDRISIAINYAMKI